MRNWRLFAKRARGALLVVCCAGVAVAGRGAAAQASSAPERTFDVEAYDVDGAKLLPQAEVEAAVYPFLGPGRTAADIDHAREALQKAYGDHGFQSVVVELPPQSVNDNIVRLHVVEAPVGRLRVTGSRFYSPEVIRKEAAAFQEGQVPNIDQAQKEMGELNRLPDRRVTPLLHAGVIPGTVDVDLKVSDTLPLHASLELNNDHNQNTPPLRLLSTIHYDNLWQLGHSASFTYAVAPQDRSASEIFSGSYLAPIWGTPWSVMANGYHSNSNVATLGGTNVLGKGYAVGLHAILQAPSEGDLSQTVNVGIDFKNFDEKISLGANGTPDTIQYVPFSIVYGVQRQGAMFTTKVSLGLTVGIRGLGSDPGTFDNKRSFATADFVHLNLDVSQTEALGRGFEAAQRFSGQVSDQPLVSSEQFAAGGLASVRGYLQSEAIGDSGFSGAIELRSPPLAPKFAGFVDDLRVFAFADGAVASVRRPLAEQADFITLASTGLGLRVGLFKHFNGEVDVATPLIAGAATRKDRPRFNFSLKSDY